MQAVIQGKITLKYPESNIKLPTGDTYFHDERNIGQYFHYEIESLDSFKKDYIIGCAKPILLVFWMGQHPIPLGKLQYSGNPVTDVPLISPAGLPS